MHSHAHTLAQVAQGVISRACTYWDLMVLHENRNPMRLNFTDRMFSRGVFCMFIIPFVNISVWLSFFIYLYTICVMCMCRCPLYKFHADSNHIATHELSVQHRSVYNTSALVWFKWKPELTSNATFPEFHLEVLVYVIPLSLHMCLHTPFVFCTHMYLDGANVCVNRCIDRIYIIDAGSILSRHRFDFSPITCQLACNHIIDELHVCLIVDDTFGIIEKNCKCLKRIFNHLTCIEHVTNYNYLCYLMV